MDYYFWFVQFIGIVAWGLLVISYYREDTNRILFLQIVATILYVIHYYLLGAYSGLFICTFEVLRDFLYYKTDKDDYIFMISIPVYVVGGFFSYSTLIDLFPIVSSLCDAYTLTKKKRTVVLGAVISYTLWVIYDIYVMSISGAITDGVVVLSNLFILIFQGNLFEKHDSYKSIRPRKIHRFRKKRYM